MSMDFVAELLIIAPPILFALTIHEYAHGYVAYKLGDPTAKDAGRLTLNPLAHLDPIGTLMLFIVKLGWAKPVPVNPYNFRNPRQDMMWVSFAGPASNFLAAFALAIVFKFVVVSSPYGISQGSFLQVLLLMLKWGVLINIILGVFNLIPIPPLDGSKILMGILPPAFAYQFAVLERFGPFLLIFILMISYSMGFNLFWMLIRPFVAIFSVILGISFY
jgi:Zn-dependent protease